MADAEEDPARAMDGDYEGGRFDQDGEFWYDNKRSKRTWTKEDALYGVFNESAQNTYLPKGGKVDNKPIKFVSAASNKKEESDKRNANDASATATRPNHTSNDGWGAGMGGGGAGLGFDDDSDDDDDDDAMHVDKKAYTSLPASFGSTSSSSSSTSKRSATKGRFAGVAVPPAAGKWEQHTKGIGSKLLEKMGWKQGEGLGRDGGGIAKPIVASLRPSGVGIGFGRADSDFKPDDFLSKKLMDEKREREEEEEKKRLESQQTWKKAVVAKRKKKVVYKTADDIIKEKAKKSGGGGKWSVSASPSPSGPTNDIIVDMRGPEVRILPTQSVVSDDRDPSALRSGTPTTAPQLAYNVRVLVDMTELDIQNLDRRKQKAKGSLAAVRDEKLRARQREHDIRSQIDRTKEVLDIVRRCRDRLPSRGGGGNGGFYERQTNGERQAGDNKEPLTLEKIGTVFELLQDKYEREYVALRLPSVAFAMAYPLFRDRFRTWWPIKQPTYMVEEMEKWKRILKADVFLRDPASDLYYCLMYNAVFARIRLSLSTEWDVRDASSCLAFLKAWDSLLPTPIRNNILHNLIYAKLEAATAAWDPRTDVVPVHEWLLPWVPFIGEEKMSSICAGSVRQKIGLCLAQWHPSDPSARAMLQPWVDVFPPIKMDELLVKCIIPKLDQALSNIVINPLNQDIAPVECVLVWADLLSVGRVVSLFDRCFFPNWLKVLKQWLASGPDFEEVTNWYRGWKSLFPAEVQNHERIRAHFQRALQMMNAAVS